MRMILASKSPRRKDILEKAGYKFDIIPSKYEIDIVGEKYTDDILLDCVNGKLHDVEKKIINDINNVNDINDTNNIKSIKDINTSIEETIIISADTVVVLEDEIIGKPKDYEDAKRILKRLSNKTHFVATGIALAKISFNVCENVNESTFSKTKVLYKNGIEKTYVTFRELTDNDISNYVEKFKPFDKAGAYGIQDEGFDFVKNIKGNMDTVIGFPMKVFENLIGVPYNYRI